MSGELLAPARRDVETALERVLASSGFVDAGRLGPFLRHLVAQTLSADTSRLKESVLGVEVFQRPPDYDPRIDPIVRVEARRLRTRLEEYYAGPGASESVRICLPKGTYVPVFALKTAPIARRKLPSALAALLVLGAFGSWWFWGGAPRVVPGGKSLAVFPFVNLSQDKENEYFSDGLTEELINAVSRVEGIRVAARSLTFQYKGKALDVREIGRKLNVSSVLEGSVRRSGDRLRVTAQLINVGDGYQLWSHTYERHEKDLFAVQEEIAQAIVNALRLRLGAPQKPLFVSRYTTNLAAYNLYLRARFQFNTFSKEGVLKSRDYLEQTLVAEPGYAPAHAMLATLHCLMGYYGLETAQQAWSKAKEHARRAIELDASLSQGHSALAFALGFLDWDWKGCERESLRAIELDPASADAHSSYATACLLPAGRLDEAKREFGKSLELDPLGIFANYVLAFTYLSAGEPDRAVEQYLRTIELKPDHPDVFWDLGMAYGYAGKYKEAEEYFRKSYAAEGGNARARLGALELVLTGRREEATQLAARQIAPGVKWDEPNIDKARHLAMAGEKEAAIRMLAESVRLREWQAMWIKADPRMAPLKGDPRYEALVKRVGLQN